jgi:hypothetical protein
MYFASRVLLLQTGLETPRKETHVAAVSALGLFPFSPVWLVALALQ